MKRVFKIIPSAHPNASPQNDYEIHQWLVAVLTEHAQNTRPSQLSNESMGTPVDVIVEVLV